MRPCRCHGRRTVRRRATCRSLRRNQPRVRRTLHLSLRLNRTGSFVARAMSWERRSRECPIGADTRSCAPTRGAQGAACVGDLTVADSRRSPPTEKGRYLAGGHDLSVGLGERLRELDRRAEGSRAWHFALGGALVAGALGIAVVRARKYG